MESSSSVSAVLEVHRAKEGDLSALEAALGHASKDSHASDSARTAIATVLRAVSARADSSIELARDGIDVAFAELCSAVAAVPRSHGAADREPPQRHC